MNLFWGKFYKGRLILDLANIETFVLFAYFFLRSFSVKKDLTAKESAKFFAKILIKRNRVIAFMIVQSFGWLLLFHRW